jgi:nucleoside 2-deoxyribosyltransferase
MKKYSVRKPYYFLCTPLYSWDGSKLRWDKKMHKEWRNIVRHLESNGLNIVVALRDLPQNRAGSWLRRKEFELIKNANSVIVLLGNTPGIYAKSGYAKGLGRPLYGIRTERLKDFEGKVKNWIESIYTEVFDDVDSLVRFLAKKEIKTY